MFFLFYIQKTNLVSAFLLYIFYIYKGITLKLKKAQFTYLKNAIIVAATEGLVREEQLLHDMCLLGAVTVEITQILTRAGNFDISISEPLLR